MEGLCCSGLAIQRLSGVNMKHPLRSRWGPWSRMKCYGNHLDVPC